MSTLLVWPYHMPSISYSGEITIPVNGTTTTVNQNVTCTDEYTLHYSELGMTHYGKAIGFTGQNLGPSTYTSSLIIS